MQAVPGTLHMALVESLLTAIVRADGDALVMHVGEKPYVVAASGHIELSSQGLNLQAMSGMVAQLLPPDAQRALTEFGAVEHELPAHPQTPSDRFSVVVARGGDDVWIEVRRHRASAAQPEPVAATESPVAQPMAEMTAPEVVIATPAYEAVAPEPMGAATELAPEVVTPEPMIEAALEPAIVEPVTVAAVEQEEAPAALASAFEIPVEDVVNTELPKDPEPVVHSVVELPKPESEPVQQPEAVIAASYGEVAQAVGSSFTSSAAMNSGERRGGFSGTPASPASVIPMTRTLRIEVPPSGSMRQSSRGFDLERLLGLAASRNATAVYLTAQASPHLRVDGEMRVFEGEPPLSTSEIESALADLMPEASRDAMRRGEPTEWVADVAAIGSVRCATFRDHRGTGAIFQLISTRPPSAEQLGLSAEIQALATETEGLVLVAASQGQGKTSLIGALVDVINQQLPNYVITLERQVRLVHDHRQALISQRDVHGTVEQMIAAARAALRESPDVLVIEDVSSPEMFRFALEAAGSGVLVIASVTAPSTTGALTRAIEFFPQEDRGQIQALIAERLRGAIAQVLLRKAAGGRVAAREVLLATTAVTAMLSDGQVQDLPRAFESGRKFGLISMTEALVALLRNGTIDLREAYRKADDRQALLAALKRDNIDTSAIERLA